MNKIFSGNKTLKVITMMFLMITMLLQGCSDSSSSSTKSEKSSGEANGKTMSTDVVVVGSGSTGVSAAVQAKQLGLNVIMIEKNPGLGGTSAVTEGYGGINTELQTQQGIHYDVKDVLLQAEGYHHWFADANLLKKFYENSGETFSWLQSLGVKFSGLRNLGANKLNTWHLYDGGGKALTETLAENAKKMGVEILTDTSGKELIMKDGKVAGIKATHSDGSSLTIKAPVVILATGGYSDNPEMLEKYAKVNADNVIDAGIPGRTGDGINMALKVGASDKNLKGGLMAFGAMMKGAPYGGTLHNAIGRQPLLRINQDGMRFTDESLLARDWGAYGAAHRLQGTVYQIASKANLDNFVQNKFPRDMTPEGKIPTFFEDLDKYMKKEKTHVVIADTIEELASKLNMNEEQLKATVDQYNADCQAGVDSQFGKDPKFLIAPGENGPYYAFKLDLGYYATTDGLAITTDAQVLDMKGKVIPGLYAGGGDAGGLNGESYDVSLVPGSQQGWAVNSGRFAAKHAAVYLKK
ncbi:FAD-dependent oxidoreductase [Neobacillus sp. LXY-4]|uniref:FAD-dependent oxidoreductase n=1 Tax=Neobacillus sp. LXY-4 TaxID=3379826 RepID=UPI003EE2A960